jgi:branched-subunit amino acid transport protein
MHIWLIIISVGLLTYAIRVSGIMMLAKRDLPTLAQQALRFVPLTVLPAIIAQELILHSGTADISLQNMRLIAGLLAAIVAWRTRNVILTIIVGMGALWLLQTLLK